jgi:hypothetical protein
MASKRRLRDKIAEALGRRARRIGHLARPRPALISPRVRLHGLACCPCCHWGRVDECERAGGEWLLAVFPAFSLLVTTADLCDGGGCRVDHHAEAVEMLLAAFFGLRRGELKADDLRTSRGWGQATGVTLT